VEHFVPPAGIEIVRQVSDTGVSIPVYENTDSFELLTNGILATG
jgi:hypothetical protein